MLIPDEGSWASDDAFEAGISDEQFVVAGTTGIESGKVGSTNLDTCISCNSNYHSTNHYEQHTFLNGSQFYNFYHANFHPEVIPNTNHFRNCFLNVGCTPYLGDFSNLGKIDA